MIHTVANGIDVALSNIDMAMTVLDAAIEQACRAQSGKAESGVDRMWMQEIKYIDDLMTAAFVLMKRPIEELEDVQNAARQLAKEAKQEPQTYDIPPELAEVVQDIANRKGITTDEAAALLVHTGLKARGGDAE